MAATLAQLRGEAGCLGKASLEQGRPRADRLDREEASATRRLVQALQGAGNRGANFAGPVTLLLPLASARNLTEDAVEGGVVGGDESVELVGEMRVKGPRGTSA